MELGHNQPCPILHTCAGVDVSEKHYRNSDFEFYGRMKEATGKHNLQKLISDGLMLVVNDLVAVL